MKKLLDWATKNILFILTLFLLFFIPLYPKIPLLDITNTWVYVRVEDFVVLFALFFYLALLFKKKITIKTPLTIPILLFWVIGGIATIHGIVIIFPSLANVFPNVAFLSYIRHIEYMSVFFLAFSSIKEKKHLNIVIAVLIATLLAVIAYGLGQKFAGFPAYLTMNEEFAKGIPIQLSALGRVPSTFAGHYDLAAYLVLILPIVASLFFGFRNIFVRIVIAISLLLGIALLFLTVSRVSFFVLFISLFLVVLFQSRKLALLAIPGAFAGLFLLIYFQPNLLSRFGNTVQETNVLVDAVSGEAIGHVKTVSYESVKNRIIQQTRVKDKGELDRALTGNTDVLEEVVISTPSGKTQKPPKEVPLVVAVNVSTGEDLPQGTGYINLPLSPVTKRLGNFYYELPLKPASSSAEVVVLHGDFLIKRAAAYDLSFTTRFQGEWPRALASFGRNIFFGSGYGSVSLAVDNNYFRMLGEIGLLGVTSFLAILLLVVVYIKKILPDIDSSVARSFVLGFAAGLVGLILNATLIDVFEASKVAFVLWLLIGINVGILVLYKSKPINVYKELRYALTSPYAVVSYLLLLSIFVYSPFMSNYFVGDDFTWFRWAADCGASCKSLPSTIISYFVDSQGFFFRPGTKIYFLIMYKLFWLNQVVYHAVSIGLHFAVASLFFILVKRIMRNTGLAVLAAFMFLIMSGYAEEVFWISATGHLFNAVFALFALLLFMSWEEGRSKLQYIGVLVCTSLALLFHELGVVIPILLLSYKLIFSGTKELSEIVRKTQYYVLFTPVIGYLVLRFISASHWVNGDYSYNLLKFPMNFVGNTLGYLILTVFGPTSLNFYTLARSLSRENILISAFGVLAISAVTIYLYKKFFGQIDRSDRRIIIFGFAFFIINLLPFIGFGNIAARYSYLASLGVIMLIALIFKKLYDYLSTQGRDIAVLGITVTIATFSLLHIIQLQKIHGDWDTAGNMANKFFISIDELYTNNWSKEPVSFHFVNVPIRTGDAWVFPVGLSDALWFTFQNDNLKVYTHQNLKSALDSAGTSITDRVFEFQSDGSVKEVIRFKDGFPINILAQ